MSSYLVLLLAAGGVGWLLSDLLWRRSMHALERDYYRQFPNGCLRCVAERHGDVHRANTMDWKHSPTCTKGAR